MYGTEILRIIPGSRVFEIIWARSCCLRGAQRFAQLLPDLLWVAASSSHCKRWVVCARASELEVQDLARDLSDRQPARYKPRYLYYRRGLTGL